MYMMKLNLLSVLLTIEILFVLVSYMFQMKYQKEIATLAEKSRESGWVEIQAAHKSISFKSHFDDDKSLNKTYLKMVDRWVGIKIFESAIIAALFFSVLICVCLALLSSRENSVELVTILILSQMASYISYKLTSMIEEHDILYAYSDGIPARPLELVQDYFNLKVYAGSQKESLAKENSLDLEEYIIVGICVNEDSLVKEIKGKTISLFGNSNQQTMLYYLGTIMNNENQEEHIFRIVY